MDSENGKVVDPVDDGPSFGESVEEIWNISKDWVISMVESYPELVIVCASLSVFLIILCCISCCICKRNRRRNQNKRKATEILEGLEQEYRLEDSIVQSDNKDDFLDNDSILMS